jgi:hypothetical protein
MRLSAFFAAVLTLIVLSVMPGHAEKRVALVPARRTAGESRR